MNHEPIDFDTFYRSAKDGCFRAVMASVGSRAAAEDIVAEAFARAWASWPKVSRHPAPQFGDGLDLVQATAQCTGS